ncbi:MAG: hypothetical protein PVSMB4_09990 [Ktedonobacterales bacterium]
MAHRQAPERPAAETPRTHSAAHTSRFGMLDHRTHWLETGDILIYSLVGIGFLLAAILSLLYGLLSFVVAAVALVHSGLTAPTSKGAGANAIIAFVSDLLLTLIILEVMGTVVRYLQTRETSLKPFLFIGIISATRGILAVGARLSVSSLPQFTGEEFRNSMIELGVNAAVIIALGITLRLIGRYLEDVPSAFSEQTDTPPSPT